MNALPMDGLHARDGSAVIPVAIHAATVAPWAGDGRSGAAGRLTGYEERSLGVPFGLDGFGVGLTRLAPGATVSRAGGRDRFVYVMEGEVTLVVEATETALTPGLCVGLPAVGRAALLVNRGVGPATLFEVADHQPPGA